jgi:hypothetical protein
VASLRFAPQFGQVSRPLLTCFPHLGQNMFFDRTLEDSKSFAAVRSTSLLSERDTCDPRQQIVRRSAVSTTDRRKSSTNHFPLPSCYQILSASYESHIYRPRHCTDHEEEGRSPSSASRILGRVSCIGTRRGGVASCSLHLRRIPCCTRDCVRRPHTKHDTTLRRAIENAAWLSQDGNGEEEMRARGDRDS